MPEIITLSEEHCFAFANAKLQCTSGQPSALRSLLLVGAKNDEEGELSKADTFYLEEFMKFCVEMRWPITPGFRVMRTNIEDGLRNDFLSLQGRFDAVIFCYLYHAPQDTLEPAKQMAQKDSCRDIFLQSRHHNQEERWHKKLQSCGVKVIGNVKSRLDSLDLPNEWIARNPYGLVKPILVQNIPVRVMHIIAHHEWPYASGHIVYSY